MIDLFSYEFFKNALWGLILISVASAVLGTYIVSRRLVALCGGITHACFGGLGLGYFLGMNPLVMASVFAVGSSTFVEWMASRYNLREDSVIAVVWSMGMALGIMFVFLTPGYVPELNTFLFGNVLTISCSDIVAFALFTALLLAFFFWRRRAIVACAFDSDFSRVAGLPVRFVRYTMTVFIAVGIVLTIRLVGVMLLMSMFTLPQLCAEIYCHRISTIAMLSVAISVAASVVGLLLACFIDVPCSALIVIIMGGVYLVCRALRRLTSHSR